jgi:transposase-like protein
MSFMLQILERFMSTRYTRTEWQVWLEEYRQSDLSVKQFCELIEVSVATFYNWQRKLKQSAFAATDAQPTVVSETALAPSFNFVEALVPRALASDHVEIRLPAGASISLPNEVSSLKPILQTLAEIGANS